MPAHKTSSDRIAARILWSMVVGLILGVAAWWLTIVQPSTANEIKWFARSVCDPLGKVFLRLLFMVVVPLVFASLALGVVQLGRLDKLGPLAGRTFALFGLNMAIGVALGLVMMNLLQPGKRIDPEKRDQIMAQFASDAQKQKDRAAAQEAISFRTLVDWFLPANLLKAVVEFQVLPLIVFALLIGAVGTQLAETRRRQLQEWLEIISELMTTLVHWALQLAPIAVPAMIFAVVVTSGLEFLFALIAFVGGVLVVMALHLFGTMPLLLKLLTRRSPIEFFRAIRTILVTAFSTSSSNATLPTTIQVSRERLGVSASTAGFVLPLGATMNMSGTALYEGCVVLFIAQVFGVDLPISKQIVLLLLTVLSAVAVAGVPGASLPLIVGLLVQFGIPGEGIALILGADRILDMARTTLNVGADVVTAVIVDDSLAARDGSGAALPSS